MKTLLMIRHAKSSWAEFGQPDIDRPLNDRGKKDAPEMAQRVKDKHLKIDAFVTSPAKRARKTARLFGEIFKKDVDDFFIEDRLYEAGRDDFYAVVSDLDNAAKSVALFSHNPGITDFVNSLCSVRIDDMPTCAVFGVTADIQDWKEFREAAKQFLFFDYPKNNL